MAASAPEIRTVSKIKSSLLQPALTSHYECFFDIPNTFPSSRQGTVKKFVEASVPVNTELLILSCSEASLPGSNLATHELNNDFTGVTQRHAYRRLYDDRTDFTFYVNNEYNQIRVFERWMQFIAGEQEATAANLNTFYRVAYPKSYKTTIYITKFERTAKPKTGKGRENETNGSSYNSKRLYYSFFNAFPISISSMPVSYESSSLLKCTVSFTYDRYLCSPRASSAGRPGEPGAPSTAIGVPNPFSQGFTPETQAALNAAYIQNVDLGISSSGTFTNTNLSGVFDGSDPTRVFQRSELNQLNSQIYSGNTRLF
jgi:hypothetical protein